MTSVLLPRLAARSEHLLMAKRIRTTLTIPEDNPVPRRRRSRKKEPSVAVVILIAFLILFVMIRGEKSSLHHPAPVTAQH